MRLISGTAACDCVCVTHLKNVDTVLASNFGSGKHFDDYEIDGSSRCSASFRPIVWLLSIRCTGQHRSLAPRSAISAIQS